MIVKIDVTELEDGERYAAELRFGDRNYKASMTFNGGYDSLSSSLKELDVALKDGQGREIHVSREIKTLIAGTAGVVAGKLFHSDQRKDMRERHPAELTAAWAGGAISFSLSSEYEIPDNSPYLQKLFSAVNEQAQAV
jgi:hypothetical protein